MIHVHGGDEMNETTGKIVGGPQVKVRNSPKKSGEKIELLSVNTPVKVTKSKNDYYKIQYGTNYSKSGWVNKAYVLLVRR